MKCPYCNKEMELGIIQSAREIAWKEGLERTKGRADAYEGSVVLSSLDFFAGSAVKASNCRECKKIIISYSSSPDLNK